MSGNTRGKLKEEMEGLHRNLDWIVAHSAKCLTLLEGKHEGLSAMFVAMGASAKTQDEILQDVYASL